jgi:peptidoglycan LD-endopeptidase LytH
MRRLFVAMAAICAMAFPALGGAGFGFPTANRTLLDPDGGAERFYVGTQGKEWTSGQFGCVRSDGYKFHEGDDIRCLTRDRRGEPIDEVMAAADGEVAYVNHHPGLSNYGNYIVLRHRMDAIETYTLYAHLSEIAPGIAPGAAVKTGQRIATMGRTSNTRQSITKERAHCHFEINLVANERFSEWFARTHRGERND